MKVEYYLTKKGEALAPIMIEMANFSMQWEPKQIFKNEKPSTIKQTFGTEMLAELWD